MRNIKINNLVKLFIVSDVLIVSGFGLLAPIFAVFITDNIVGGSLEVVGISSMIYALTYGLSQIPFGLWIDKIRGERDDFWFMFIGSMGISTVPFLYLLVETPIALYITQFVYGAFSSMISPAWMAIFTRHIDDGQEGFQWSVYNTLVSLGTALAAAVGAFFASRFGFDNLFIVVGVLSLIGSFALLFTYRNLRKS